MKEMLTNKILTDLTDTEFARLMPLLEPISLSGGERLAEPGEMPRFVYFPENSIISAHADMQDGKTVEVGMVGYEGVTGFSSFPVSRPPSHSLNVSIAGSALRIGREVFQQELERSLGLRKALDAYAGQYLTQVSQRFACAVLHHIEQRLAVWLLLLTDRLDIDVIQITQERISQHLGVRRSGVTVLAGEMQAMGAISYTRGTLHIRDRQALRSIACECYGALAGASHQTAHR